MSARYLVRFDDICPTMNWAVWKRIEAVLRQYSVTPILAVIPDNRDPKLVASEVEPGFWDRVRQWQEWGWTIGLHGYQHVYDTGEAGLIGLKKASEFAGHPFELQETRIANGLKIFRSEGIEPSVWIAPGHSFDETTIKVLLRHGIRVISDGYFLRPVRYRDIVWIPQQLWRFRFFPLGVWTVCHHHNSIDEKELEDFERNIRCYASKLTSFEQIVSSSDVRDFGVLDRLTTVVWLQTIQIKQCAATISNRFSNVSDLFKAKQ